MMDQAEKLREIIDTIKIKQTAQHEESLHSIVSKTAKIITVTSGKGGVGKTNITANLGIILSELGYKVTILDGDLGLANIDVLFGIIPEFTLLDVIYNKKNILQVISKGPRNVNFISGGSGVEELIKLEKNQLDFFIRNITLLDKLSDIILIDTGAGLSESVMKFVMAADEVILVTTPEPTSITDAYALIKMVSARDKEKLIKVIVNRAESSIEAWEVLNRLSDVTEKFLNLKLYPLGYVLHDDLVVKAVKMQQPFTISFPKSVASKQIKEISRKLIEFDGEYLSNQNKGMKGFINKFLLYLSN